MSDIKITKERIDALLSEADIRTLTLFGKCTVVTAKLKNGFVLTADSACVDPANYDKRMGERICLEHIANKLWELEGYRLQWDVFSKANRKDTAPGLGDEALDEMRTLCSRALRAWGAEMQSVVAAEELSELQKELCKSVRGADNTDAIAEEIADVQIMLEHMTSDFYPLLAPRRPRWKVRTLTKPNGFYAHDGLYWVDGTGFYADGTLKGTVTNGRKKFASLGAYIIILPDKKYYNRLTDEFGTMEASFTGSAKIQDGTYAGEDAKANTCSTETESRSK